ncbi:AMP-binding protein [Nocardia sp. R7R-8]|uniref:AMP-binding protein n=1 Tax=Nocardia sp. R7R-8 TaxID=3459304 RepID=UPI00403DBE2F
MIAAPITRWIEYWAEVKPECPAIIFEDGEVTWRDFRDSVNRWARMLSGQGIGRGERVACMMRNRPEFYFAFFAVAKLGAVFVPVNLQLTDAEISFLIDNSGARALVYDSAKKPIIRDAADINLLPVDGAVQRLLADPVAAPQRTEEIRFPQVGFDDLVAILYTSGTTGRPKGAMITHSNIHFAAETISRSFDFTQQDIHIVTAPLYFAGGIVTVSQPVFVSGGTVVLTSYRSPADTLDLIARHRVTVAMIVPAILNLLINDESFEPGKLKSLRLVAAGTAPVQLPLIEAYRSYGIDVYQGYGLTEAGGVSTFLLPQYAEIRTGSVGSRTMYTEISVVRPDGSLAEPGEPGEILQRGPTVTTGYWENSEATAELLAPGGWIRTGDLGVLDSDGFLWIVGRIKDVIICGGVNVYPAEIESVLAGHPDVLEVAVIGLPHDTYGETVTAVVVPVSGRKPDLEKLREFCRTGLAHYKIPRLLKVVDELPRTGSGKVRKNVLRDALA